MAQNKIVYEEKKEIYFRYYQTPDVLEYESRLIIKEKGKQPVSIELIFSGIEPLAAPIPPRNHIISGESIADLFTKICRWARKYGYSVC